MSPEKEKPPEEIEPLTFVPDVAILVPCRICRFWRRRSNAEGEKLRSGQCRRYPPTLIPAIEMTNQGPRTSVKPLWPLTAEDELGCGEGKPRDGGAFE